MTASPEGRPQRRIPPLDDVSAFELLGRIVVAWNNYEAICRHLLTIALGGQPMHSAVTLDLGTLSLCHALEAIAPSHREVSEHLVRTAKALNVLREHRNYFIHGASNVEGPTGKETMVLMGASARGEIKIFEDKIDKRKMRELELDCSELATHAFNLYLYLMFQRSDRAVDVPDLPFLPPKITKTRTK